MEKFFYKKEKQKFAQEKKKKEETPVKSQTDDIIQERVWTKMKEKSARAKKEIENVTDIPHLLFFHLKNKLSGKKILLHDPAYTPKEYQQDAFEVIAVKLEKSARAPILELKAKDYTHTVPAS